VRDQETDLAQQRAA
jgi:hypothetical protein